MTGGRARVLSTVAVTALGGILAWSAIRVHSSLRIAGARGARPDQA